MHDLPEAPRQPRMVRVAALILSIALLLLVLLAGWRLVQQQRDLDARGHRLDALIANAKAADRDAAQDRATAAANQLALLDYTKALADRQDALLAYLRAHGIHLPDRLVTTIPAPRVVHRRHHVARAKGKPNPRLHRSSPRRLKHQATTRHRRHHAPHAVTHGQGHHHDHGHGKRRRHH